MKKFTAILLVVILIFSILCLSGCDGLRAFLDDVLNGGGSDDIGGTDGPGGNGNGGNNGGNNGNNGGDGNNNGGDNIGDGGHVHQFDSYFTYSQCSVFGCSVIGRRQGQDTYANDFTYSLTDAKIDDITALYDEILSCLADGDDYDYFESLYDE